MSDLICKNLLIGVSGGVQSAFIAQYLNSFRLNFAENIRLIMTEMSTTMVSRKVVDTYLTTPSFLSLWDRHEEIRAPHIQLPNWADLFIVVPASANCLGKAANGIADDLLSTAILSYSGTIIFAPAMNPLMWENKIVQRNVNILKEVGHYIVPPLEGISVTTGKWDTGLGPTPEELLIHAKHVRMKELKQGYWAEATSRKPQTPIEKKLLDLTSNK
ncbi:flavoprotein [Deinococcus xianganensis]|uniref:Flavoprotein domain-containing protein n=1 Tax=Deinococcus xianganensis TaxID=1507289 RepID=A0A6I4YNS7_9DEIO|nr:flavoprotein [Deinococcus xianganensis]MXV21741.1 hypothetical protein [Deinococcus xianganensis]